MSTSEEGQEEEEFSMVDVLQEDNELEEEANAVLGGSDDQNCTYPSGYIKRQALYACGTCTPKEEAPTGVCLACSLACHEGHELFELYTKRNFCCDCGNTRFASLTCKLQPNKEAENKENKYNQNFHGVYCTCSRPYPDPEDEVEDEMIQCVVCEDWFHSRHLGNLPPAGGDFQEMICDSCVEKCSFLQAYLSLSVPHQQTLGKSQQIVTNEEKDVKVEVASAVGDKDKLEQTETSGPCVSAEDVPDVKKPQDLSQTKKSKVTDDTSKHACKGEEATATSSKTEQDAQNLEADAKKHNTECKLIQLQATVTEIKNGATYWHTGWREQLCRCPDCKALYKKLEVPFLTDEMDTVVAYEEEGRGKKLSQYESGMAALQNMGRIQQVEVMHEFNDMKSELTDYLREFASEGKVVKKEDVTKFFESLQARKRQRLGEGPGVQYKCR